MERNPAATLDEIERELGRVVDRLRSLSLTRLREPVAGRASRADAAVSTAQALADACAALERAPRRELPRLADAAVVDQVAVTGADVVAAARVGAESESDAAARARHLDAALTALVTLRRAL